MQDPLMNQRGDLGMVKGGVRTIDQVSQVTVRNVILKILDFYDGNRSKTADALGVSRKARASKRKTQSPQQILCTHNP